MNTVEKMNKGEYLIIDPCYIETGFDNLVRELTWRQGDGMYAVFVAGEYLGRFGVDSGELVLFRAIDDCEIEVDAGFSGFQVLTADLPVDDVEAVLGLDEEEDY